MAGSGNRDAVERLPLSLNQEFLCMFDDGTDSSPFGPRYHIMLSRRLIGPVNETALRGALLPIVSYAGPAAAALLTGSIIVETIFAIPGVGRYFVQAALNRDYTLVMGTVVVIALFTILFNLIVDILYAVVDPRVRYD